MAKIRSSREAGLTMLEVVIAAIILAAIVGMTSWLVWSASSHITTAEVQVQLEMSSREVLSMISKELHQTKMTKISKVDTKDPIPCDPKSLDPLYPTPGNASAPGTYPVYDVLNKENYVPLSQVPAPTASNKFDGIRFRTPGKMLDLVAVNDAGQVKSGGKWVTPTDPNKYVNNANADLNGKPLPSDPTKTYQNFDLTRFKVDQGAADASRWLYEVQYWWEIDNTGLKPEGDIGLGPNLYVRNGKDDNDNGVIDEGVIRKMETWYKVDDLGVVTVDRRTVSTVLRDVINFEIWVPRNPSWVVLKPGQDPTVEASWTFDSAYPVNATPNQYQAGLEQNVVLSVTVSKADPRHPKIATKNIVKTYTMTVDLRN
jgi:type II secretory pathway component PulJ